MTSERIQRQITSLLDEADAASKENDWKTVHERADAALAFEPSNVDAQGYLEAALRRLHGEPTAAPLTEKSVPVDRMGPSLIRDSQAIECPDCSYKNPDEAAFCSRCGALLHSKCPECGSEIENEGQFCPECGVDLDEMWEKAQLPARRIDERRLVKRQPSGHPSTGSVVAVGLLATMLSTAGGVLIGAVIGLVVAELVSSWDKETVIRIGAIANGTGGFAFGILGMIRTFP